MKPICEIISKSAKSAKLRYYPGLVWGFTLVELLVGVVILIMAITALLGAFIGQTVLNEHHRNLSWAMNDARQVMERLRQLNIGCGTPTALASALPVAECGGAACASWDAWVASASGGGGKSIQPTPAVNELVTVSNPNPGGDPLQVAVAVCWRHRNRTFGECTWSGVALSASDGSNGFAADGIIQSPAALSTFLTCRP